ncbi:MAG: 50S ribosomal protein L15 [Caldiserica bacterium]|nr:MAG: 50S ribosomal protein L15 [Caldisericota bacterium]
MKLNELVKVVKKKPKRVGRGTGSGHGRYSGRGIKGAKSRVGTHQHSGFEGGQMPLIRRIPKRGFTPVERKEFEIVNLKDINEKFNEGEVVNIETLKQKCLIKGKKDVKILGDGEIKKKLKFEIKNISKGARKKIEEAGGSIIAN